MVLLRQNLHTVRRIYVTVLILFVAIISANAQGEMAAASSTLFIDDAGTATVQGRITTTDNQPAGFVTVGLREINRFTITDEKGAFLIRNVKPGNYTLLVSMAGLQPQ